MVSNRIDSQTNYDIPVGTNHYAWRVHPDVPPTGDDKCLFNYRWLRVYLLAKTGLGEIKSSPSNQVTIMCPQPLGDSVDIEVNFYSLTLDNIDDGGGDTTADSVNGIFGTSPSGNPPGIHFGYENYKLCGYYWSVLDTSGGVGCHSLNAGAYLMEDLQLCPMAGPPTYYGCNNDNEFGHNNNKIIVTLRDQDALKLFVHLIEYDNASDNDTVCDQQVWLGPWPLTTWASLEDASVWLNMNDNGYASCAVQVLLNTLKPGQ
jgi:hypothetical protein